MTNARGTANGPTTKFAGGVIVAFGGGKHRLLSGGEVLVRGDSIVAVGARSDAAADRVIELGGRLAIPGFVSTHAHIGAHEATRLLIDAGRREFMRSGFLNFVPTGPSGASFFHAADREASLRFGLLQLLRNGVTTVVNFDHHADALLPDLAGECGIRLYFAPTANDGSYRFDDAGMLSRTIDKAAGLKQLDTAVKFIQRHDGAHDGRVRGIVVVDEFYNSTPDLRRRAKLAARDLNVRLTMHFSEQLFEFHETVRATGRTPVQVLADEGVLGPDVILAHCIYVAGHSMASYPYVDDLGTLARSGAHVAHSPAVFARRGVTLESLQKYLDKGVRVALGNDVFPMDMIEEMRVASLAGKIADRNHEAASAGAVFNAATLGGAAALGRSDIGRIAPGAKADIVVIDLENIWTAPYADPIRALVTSGHPSMIDTVMVDGRVVVDDGRLLQAPQEQVLRDASRSLDSVRRGYSDWHWANRDARSEFPDSFERWQV